MWIPPLSDAIPSSDAVQFLGTQFNNCALRLFNYSTRPVVRFNPHLRMVALRHCVPKHRGPTHITCEPQTIRVTKIRSLLVQWTRPEYGTRGISHPRNGQVPAGAPQQYDPLLAVRADGGVV
eukprot:scaffold1167_cov66-Phaeocystis_antarctica.AAC.1